MKVSWTYGSKQTIQQRVNENLVKKLSLSPELSVFDLFDREQISLVTRSLDEFDGAILKTFS